MPRLKRLVTMQFKPEHCDAFIALFNDRKATILARLLQR
jgi:hypothetical protein